ncbi:TPA: hypothetical protein NI776_001829 [Pseudomonas aeruginosa]|nr:hypothetical protein [Pseudomonas aeruginosa]
MDTEAKLKIALGILSDVGNLKDYEARIAEAGHRAGLDDNGIVEPNRIGLPAQHSVSITLEGTAFNVLQHYCDTKKLWFAEGGATLKGQRLEHQVFEYQANLANWIERLAKRAAPDCFN